MNKKLLKNYEKAVNDIIDYFCEKQGLYFEYWVGDCVGEIACFEDIFLNFDDIIHDLKNNAPKGLIIDWYFEQLKNKNQRINYRSYIMGARFEKHQLKNEE